MPRVPSKVRIELLKSVKPTVITPESMKGNMADVGLRCPDTSTASLQGAIDEVRSQLMPSHLQAFMVAERTEGVKKQATAAQISPGEALSRLLSDDAQGLVETLQDADHSTQNLALMLAGRHPGTREFVQELVRNDDTAAELLDVVGRPAPNAHPLVERVLGGAGGQRLGLAARVAGLGSPALSFLAGLAEQDVRPLATTTWTPDSTGVVTGPYTAMLGNVIYKDHFAQLPARYQARTQQFPGYSTDLSQGPEFMKTREAVIDFFKKTCTAATTTVATQINGNDLEGLVSTYIEPMQKSVDDYTINKNRLIYLAQNYNPANQTADGVGIIAIDYALSVENYKRKEKHGGDTHQVKLTMMARGIQYPGAIGFSNLCLDNKLITGKCDPICDITKSWYAENPQYGLWPADNTECPPN